jgi:hypothetical protein
MGKEISWEIREEAEQLYIIDGKTFDEVSELTGVSAGQLQRWAAGNEEEGITSWKERKREYRTAFSNIKRDTLLLRKRMIGKALNSLNPQDVFAISSLESMAAKLDKSLADKDDFISSTGKEKVIIKTPQDAIDALSEVVELKINNLLSKPGAINLNAIKEMKQSLELIEKMKEKYGKKDTSAKKKQLDPKTLKKIREEVYGIFKNDA